MYTKNIRCFTLLLLICLTVGFLVSLVPVSAASPFDEESKMLETKDRIALYLSADNAFATAQDKVDTMTYLITRGNYELYVDKMTAEVAVKNKLTGQILATNPYDLATTPSAGVKEELMSQAVVTFEDLANNGTVKTFYSYTESAARDQIEIKNIKNGIRVEYTLGKQSARRLLPRLIEKTRFESLIKTYIDASGVDEDTTYKAKRFATFYDEINPNDPGLAKETIAKYNNMYPCTKDNYQSDYGEKMAVYVNTCLTEKELNDVELMIKQYCPHYNYEELEYDHELTKYQGVEKSPAIFRLAIEYYLSEKGLRVTVPANSIRFDEDYYRLSSVSVLQYFGTSSNSYTGYTFIPDGSGAIIRNEDIMSDGKNTYAITGQIYGPDFAYHELSGYNGKSEIMRFPIYGVVEDRVMLNYNLDNQVGYVVVEEGITEIDEITGEEAKVYYTSSDRIMVDAYNKNGHILLSEEDYLAQYRYAISDDGKYSVIKEGHKDWNLTQYKKINLAEDADLIKSLQEQGFIPYYETVNYYLMSPVVKTKAASANDIQLRQEYNLPTPPEELDFVSEIKPLTMIPYEERKVAGDAKFDYVTNGGKILYMYVNEIGEPLAEGEEPIEGVLKVKEQLYYQGEPAYYNTGVPVDPNAVIEEKPAEPAEPAEGDEVIEGEAGAEGEEQPEEKIALYDNIQKTENVVKPAYEEIREVVSQGYFAVITEGDALAQITSNHGAKDPSNNASTGLHKYNSVYTSFFPRPTDSYRLSDAISVGSSDKWTVVSDRKYTGSYTIEYTMITDAPCIEEKDGKRVESAYPYEASYVGMANVYRDYLLEKGILEAIEEPMEDIPMYLELLGMTEVKKNVLTVPVMMDTALTSFKDIEKIYDQMSGDGVKNVKARLTYFTKNGVTPLAPSGAKFERVVGGNKGYKNMIQFCADKTSRENGTSLAVYPDFDFANVYSVSLLDGLDYMDDTVKTIDDRYTGKRTYDATYQSFQRVGATCISPAAYERIYKKFAKKMSKFEGTKISAATLGTDLNSDFNEDDPYNREDTKQFTIDLLNSLKEDYGRIMIDGGNAYALGSASDILYMSLDSSQYMRASAAVPFLGMVLHGYVSYAGDPTNTASDIYYEKLKIIENGASPFFILAYENTVDMKENATLSKYYAVDYEIWYEDMVEIYKELNEALKDVQSAVITDHGFLEGIRALTENEATVVNKLKSDAIAGYDEAYAAALKEYNDKKAVAERHGEEFAATFEEYITGKDENGEPLNPYHFADAETYGEYVYNEYVESINRTVSGTQLVYVTYQRGDGSAKTFILNYSDTTTTVTLGEKEYVVDGMSFVSFEN